MLKLIPIVSLFIILNSCSNKNKIKNYDYVYKFYDTIQYNKKVTGKISLNSFQDTIEIDKKEKEIIKIYLNVFKPTKDIQSINIDECYMFIKVNDNFKNKVQTEFYVIPKIKGNAIVAGFVDHTIYLKLKDTTKLRMLQRKFYFKEKIYVR